MISYKSFIKVSKPSYALSGKNLCWECEERHLELDRWREITVDDIAASCYSDIFYKANAFEFLIPILLIKAMNKEVDIHDTFPEYFLREIRDKEKSDYFKNYSKRKISSIIEALQFLHNLYFMEEYKVWNFDNEKLVHYYEEEKLEKEVKLALVFWQDLIKHNKIQEPIFDPKASKILLFSTVMFTKK